jgi:quercetin dioxygenase-like cupin family protein
MADTVWVKTITTEGLAPFPKFGGLWRRWITPDADNRGLILALGELRPGEDMGWHAHPEAEVFYVLEGVGEARWKVGDVVHKTELRPGSAFYKTGGIPHQMNNSGSTPFRGLGIKVAAE